MNVKEKEFIDLIRGNPQSLSFISSRLGINFYKSQLIAQKLLDENKIKKQVDGLKIRFVGVR